MASNAQDATAVHWEGRQHVEHGQHDVHPQQLVQETAADLHRLSDSCQTLAQSQPHVDRRREDNVDGRSGERHHELLSRIVGHPLQPGHAANRQQRDIPRRNAVASRGECMSQFVEHDNPEQGQNVRQTIDCLTQIEGRNWPTNDHAPALHRSFGACQRERPRSLRGNGGTGPELATRGNPVDASGFYRQEARAVEFVNDK